MNPSMSRALGAFRVFFYASALLFVAQVPLGIHLLDPAFFEPTSFFALLQLPLVAPAEYVLLKYFWMGALAAAALGLCTLASAWLSFFLGLYLIGYQYNFGLVQQSDAPIAVALLALALAPAGDSFSLDALWKKKFLKPQLPPPALAYSWPLLFLKTLWVWVFFSSALLKLRLKPMDWLEGNILHSLFSRTLPFFDPSARLSAFSAGLRASLVAHPTLCQFLTWGTLALELLMPLALCFRPAARVLVPAGIFLLFGVWLSLGHYFFFYLIPLHLAWLPWEKIALRLDSLAYKIKAAGVSTNRS